MASVNPQPSLILASASPRRLQLLQQLGLEARVQAADIDENLLPDEAPHAYVERLCAAKAVTVFDCLDAAETATTVVLGADTTVVCKGRIMGKPQHREDALEMLQMLSGSTHRVITGTAIVSASLSKSVVCVTEVDFCDITPELAEAYWLSGEPQGKAGSYAIQGKAACFVQEIRGSYSNVVGLPLYETADLLVQAGINII